MKNEIAPAEFEALLQEYQSSGDTRLDHSLEALLELKASGEITDKLAIKMMRFLIGKQITLNIKTDIKNTDARYTNKRKTTMKFMGFRYGRTEEHFAI